MRDDRERLLDMLDAIGKIEQYINQESTYSNFANDELIEVWVIHHLQIIGEAASKLTIEFRDLNPNISWGKMIGMRQVLVHGYFVTDSEIIWEVVEHDIPVLKDQLIKLISSLDGNKEPIL